MAMVEAGGLGGAEAVGLVGCEKLVALLLVL